ncbi:MAG: M6 family metalloprotease domain-containing protein [Muribaculaceae bacterium]|nr:M6 family metalloprotease domain-containing protein [Muribaculaceae bacterium]
MKLNRFLLTLIASGLCLSSVAVPARRNIFTVTQPDGTELRVKRIGDEHMHIMLTDDNKLITEEDGAYYFSILDSKSMTVNTRVLATPASRRADIDPAVMMTLDEQSLPALRAARAASRPSRAIAQSGLGRFTSNFPRTGKIRSLVILVQYKDTKFTLSDPYSYFNNMLNQEGFSEYNGTGSARDYFLFNSNSQFDPDFDVFGPYTLKNNRSYYGGNDSDGYDKLPEEMVVEACKGLASQINFADYDLDNDGYVDNVFVIYAGEGEASGGPENSVWPHAWELSSAGKAFKLNGKTIDSYGCTNEWVDNRPDGVGTFVHEFSHVMGLPDLYATDYSSAVTPGEWSVLDYGPYNNDGCTPPNYSIFERNAMGWCEPTVLDGPDSVTLRDITLTNEGCIIPTTKTNEFFLLENRQQTGWDTYLPGHGMLIWHVDFNQQVWDSNEVNNTASHMYVELEKADGTSSSYNISGWSFPGTSGKTSFTNTTKPSMKTWNGTNIDMPITNIAEKNSIITFDVAGGKAPIDSPEFVGKPTINGDRVTVTWAAVNGATDYFVTAIASIGGETVTENYDSKNLPEGWTIDKGIGTYTSNTNYKTNGTSLKFQKTGNTLTTTEYDSDVTGISFWMKGQSTTGSKLTINGKINGTWSLIKEITLNKAEQTAQDVTIESIPVGVKSVQFVYTKSVGNLALDDITITVGGGTRTVIPGYDNLSTKGETMCVIDLAATSRAAADDETSYEVTVKATDGVHTSNAARITFKAGDLESSGIDNVTVGNDNNMPVEYFNMQGIKVSNPVPGNIYIRRQGNTTAKVRF